MVHLSLSTVFLRPLDLDLGEGQFDGIEVQGVGRQEAQPRPDVLHREPDRLALVRTEVIQHHHLPGTQAGREDLVDIGRKRRPVDRPGDGQGRPNARRRQRRQQGDVGTMIAGHGSHGTLPAWGSRPMTGQRRVGTGLVDETRSAGVRVPISARQAVRAASSRSVAIRDFF